MSVIVPETAETMSIRDAAKVLGFKDPSVVEKLIAAGELTAKPLVPGGRRRIYRRQLDELITRRLSQ